MDEWLANVYGTGGSNDVDLEKVAQLAILEKLANEEGYDLSGLSEDEALELADEVMAQGAEGEGEEYVEDEEDMAKEAQAKFEEADFLGRVMAHSYTQELEKIASRREVRERVAKGQSVGGHMPGKGITGKGAKAKRLEAHAARGASDTARQQLAEGSGSRIDRIVNMRGRQSQAAAADKARAVEAASPKGQLKGLWGKAKGGLQTAGKTLLKHKLPIGVGLGAAGLGAGAAYAATRKSGKSKTASAFEKLAEERAMEILEANGVEGQDETNPDDQFDDALNARAIEMLQENGYEIE